MKGDLDRSTHTNRLVPIAQCQTYTLLSRAKIQVWLDMDIARWEIDLFDLFIFLW